MTRLNPGLLRACAAYLAHVNAYAFDDTLPFLRADAHTVVLDHKLDVGDASVVTQAECDELLARAILDATPNMLAWWCERLSEGEASS